ncbi:GAF domain-containing sensor histidine kinase [Bacillus sp. NTK034]|uniref:GAF domain-containing sensor histidine kinase n=1 Tax=Bacillus sp. NTK034 TaxID=2802176 RepID=UPI001A8FE66D|nr:histidine kinase [Bacillus sp. NTK034]MBN8204184.1 histidine kinase [Bacillus sp. NTK034]
MQGVDFLKRREKYSKIFLTAVSILGLGIFIFTLRDLTIPQEPVILALLVAFLFISEYFPMPVWKGFTSISFPILYVIYLLYGFPYSLLIFSLVVFIVNFFQRRPIRIVFFNPAQLLLSFFLAEKVFAEFADRIESVAGSDFYFGLTEYVVLLFLYILFNNLIVDFVLVVRPQPYPFKVWKQKMITECLSGCISLIYGFLLYFIGTKNRGEIDVFSYFFFFSPLVGLALLSSVIVRLRKEKKRLKALFTITNELNQMLPSKDWLLKLQESFRDFMNVEALVLCIKEGKEWRTAILDGMANADNVLISDISSELEVIKSPIIYKNRKNTFGMADGFFENDIKSIVYSPLVIDNETVGMFIIGKSRTKSFEDDDIQSIATLSNQLAVILKTKMLFAEKEKRNVLEERNRIARDIHDGLAQTLAGAVMKLDTAGKKVHKDPKETVKLIDDSVWRLRQSLKEVRESIYALRPYPTERIGLISAITNKIKSIIQEHGQCVHFEIRGSETMLSPMTEKVLFDTFKESMQNAIKHSGADRIDVLLSYQTEHILLKVKDNGKGFSLYQAMLKARSQPHFGILQMNDAADKVNASLQIESQEGEGTEITITVPKMGFEGGSEFDQANAGG